MRSRFSQNKIDKNKVEIRRQGDKYDLDTDRNDKKDRITAHCGELLAQKRPQE